MNLETATAAYAPATSPNVEKPFTNRRLALFFDGMSNTSENFVLSLRSLALLVVVISASGCAHICGYIPEATPVNASGQFLAGAAKTNITPSPGYAMAGHSVAGQVSRGVWIPLYARAVYLEDGEGHAVVMACCDLLGIPAGLADRVAEIVLRDKRGHHIGREQIILAATHTHQGPGNCFSSPYYNNFASPKSGFDRALFEYLAQRIAGAILDAAANKEMAVLSFDSEKVGGLSRNRSFGAFVLDPESQAILNENSFIPLGPTSPKYPRAEAYRAIDPTVSVLKIARPKDPDSVIALVGFLAGHATALDHDAEVFQSDFFGVAATTVERRLQLHSAGAVVCIFNGPEGDISPCWDDHQDRRSVLKIGKLLAAHLYSLSSTAKVLSPPVSIRFQFTNQCLAGGKFNENVEGVLVTRRASKQAIVGTATFGGAEDGRTVFYDLGFRAGVRGQRFDHQGSKQPALDPKFIDLPFSITRSVTAASPPPTKVPLGVYSIGPLVFATLPGEFTTVMGRRVAAAIKATCTNNPVKVVLIGLANEYLSYFTTPEEYEAQCYEGASTLYGPASGPLIQNKLVALAKELFQSPTRLAAHGYKYPVGSPKCYGPEFIGKEPYRFDDGLADILQDLDQGYPLRNCPHFEWEETRTKGRRAPSAAVPKVRIEVSSNGSDWSPLPADEGGIEDNEGIRFVTVLLRANSRAFKRCAIWMPDTPPPGMQFRFAVMDSAHQEAVLHSSAAFTLMKGQ